MLILLISWIAILVGLVCLGRRQGSAGLPIAYFLGLSLIHVPGALVYLSGDDDFSLAGIATRIGFEQTVIGMLAFVVGVLLAGYYIGRPQRSKQVEELLRPQRLERINGLARIYLVVGAVTYFAAGPIIGAIIPSSTGILSPLGSLLIVGACLSLWSAREQGNRRKFWMIVATLPLFPLATLTQGGFIGFGVYWVMAIMAFLFGGSKRKAAFVLLTPAVFFVGLSTFVNYMAARDDIRRLVWYEPAGVGARLERIARVFTNFTWLDLENSQHREALDGRLNQNLLVGVAVQRLETGQVEFASGATVGNVIILLIPRAIWPDKPAVGGSGTIVADFTGMKFAEGTSIGAGQVFEFYVNFGILGVIGGFLLFGILIGWLDTRAKNYLDEGDQRRFLLYFLVGLALLQPGGSLVEIIVTVAGSIVAAYGVGRFLIPPWTNKPTTKPQTVAIR